MVAAPGFGCMFDAVLIATDGSRSVERAVSVALDLADRFGADVHALYVVDTDEVDASPESVRESYRDGLTDQGERALEEIAERTDVGASTAIREGRPASEIADHAREVGADVVALGTRGRHGENRLLLGSVAEAVVRTCPVPVLTVRQLAADEE